MGTKAQIEPLSNTNYGNNNHKIFEDHSLDLNGQTLAIIDRQTLAIVDG